MGVLEWSGEQRKNRSLYALVTDNGSFCCCQNTTAIYANIVGIMTVRNWITGILQNSVFLTGDAANELEELYDYIEHFDGKRLTNHTL